MVLPLYAGLEMMRHRSLCQHRNSESAFMRRSAITEQQNRYLPWISRMMQNMWADASQADIDICTSMPMEISILACLFIIRTLISDKRPCWKHCSPDDDGVSQKSAIQRKYAPSLSDARKSAETPGNGKKCRGTVHRYAVTGNCRASLFKMRSICRTLEASCR